MPQLDNAINTLLVVTSPNLKQFENPLAVVYDNKREAAIKTIAFDNLAYPEKYEEFQEELIIVRKAIIKLEQLFD